MPGGGGPQVTGAPSTGGQATAPARRTTTAIGVDSDTASRALYAYRRSMGLVAFSPLPVLAGVH